MGLLKPFSTFPSILDAMGKCLYSSCKDNFLSTTCNSYLQQLYQQWNQDPSIVNESWRNYFETLQSPSALLKDDAGHKQNPSQRPFPNGAVAETTYKLQQLIRAYQVRGYHKANLDPLGILRPELDFGEWAPELDPEYYGFNSQDMNQKFPLGPNLLDQWFPNSAGDNKPTLLQICNALKSIYSSTIGLEYMHIPSREQCDWLRSHFEKPDRINFNRQQLIQIFQWLTGAHTFESFVHAKFPGEKRFALEGCESFVPGMMGLLVVASQLGTKSVVLGMAHRGRVNVLSNVIQKPNESIFCEFNGDVDLSVEGSGDVKYHLGMNCDRILPNGCKINISLVANPSHLEAVDAVVLGKVKALQFLTNDTSFDSNLPVIVHGDAAFSGQGVVYEALGFSELPSYSVGGTIHVVINNQIGFTTDPRFSRSTPFCTDLAKVVNAPIMHVNGDDVEAVVFCMQLAMKWRNKFKKDVVVDLIGYRRHGHNEFDEPSFTQPRMYKAIQQKERVLEEFSRKLQGKGILTKDEAESLKREEMEKYEKAYTASKSYKPTTKEWLTSTWNGFPSPSQIANETFPAESTGISKDALVKVANALVNIPDGFHPHKGIVRLLEGRRKMLFSSERPSKNNDARNNTHGKKDSNEKTSTTQSILSDACLLDMGTAEALAFGGLLLEGHPVRLSGQDVERGTFSQRHAVFHDQEQEKQFVQLNNIDKNQSKFQICNSSLSEFGALGFEYGYSLVDPNILVLWEAQFGDFANNAQCIIDQFIVSGERKWIQRSGLTLLLPHGYDGAGPEHSNAHIERFLSLCDDWPEEMTDPVQLKGMFFICNFHLFTLEYSMERALQDCNIQIVYPTTPANYFHSLRRQVKRKFRKPLVILTSKNLLRHPMARSSLAELLDKTQFKTVIVDGKDDKMKAKVIRLILCSGQVYFTLMKAIQDKPEMEKIAIIRVEQISPFPYDQLTSEIGKYSNLKEIVWVQEEAQNVGPWFYVEPRIKMVQKLIKQSNIPVWYAGRKPYAGIATGFKKQHIEQEQALIKEAITLTK